MSFLLVGISLGGYAWDWWPTGIDNTCSGRDTLQYGMSIMGIASSCKTSPFWIQTNRFGDIAASPYSGNLLFEIIKPATQNNRWYDYDFAISLTGRVQSSTTEVHPTANKNAVVYSNLAYAHVQLYVVDITAGILPKHYGTPNESLTSGGLLFSPNAHPMPGIYIGIDRWTAIPGLYGYVELRGGIDNQWMIDNISVRGAMVHHKWIGGRIGGRLPVNISYEFHHAAQWGGYSPIYGDLGNDWRAFVNALLVGAGGTNNSDQINAQGNHIGSQILTLEARGDKWKVSAYWQNLFEDGPIRFIGLGMNNKDGIWGVNVSQNYWPFINGFTYEFIHTTDQSGPYHDKDGYIYGGGDNYFTNSIYPNGWNYWYRTIGNPFITSPIYNADGNSYTTNNRVVAHYLGIKGDIYGYKYRVICSHSDNYGTYNKPLYSQNTAIMIECCKHLDKVWGIDLSVSVAADFGNQFGNQLGAMIRIKKDGILTTY